MTSLRFVLPACILALTIGATAAAQPKTNEPAQPAATPAPAGGAAPGTGAEPSPSGAPPAAAVPAAPVAAGGGAADPAATGVRLRTLEKNVNELKEQVFRTKARLNLLKETVLGGMIGASRATIRHKNEMGSSFRLIKAVYALDGVQIYGKSDDSGRLAEMPEFDIYNGAIQPGSHTLSVVLTYQGNGYGVFSYMKGYKFNAKSSHTFVAGEGKSTMITVRGYEKGNITTNLADRPAIEFLVNVGATDSGTPATAGKK